MKKISSFKDIPETSEYIDLVQTGGVAACVEQFQLIEHIERCAREEDLYYDPDQTAQYMSYQQYFPFDLFPWEKYVFFLHICVYRADGMPRWRDLFVYGGRGLGKNGYLSFEDFCLITKTHGIDNYHIDICANSEDQAKTSFDDIYSVLDSPKNPANAKKLKHNFRWNKTVITNRMTGSEIKYRTNNAKSKDGLRSGKVDFDELHAYEDWANINVFTTGLGKKPHPRTTYVTTDGDVRGGPLDEMKARALSILDGREADNGMLPFMCRLDEDEEVHDEANWPKANPSLPYRPELLEEIRIQYTNYLREPVKHAAFMTKRMNRPQGHADTEVTSWENILKTNRELPDLTGKPCVCGIDFTQTTDFMSAVLLFRDGDGDDQSYYAMHHSWFCSRSKDRDRIKLPLDEMARRGLLTIVDDVDISPTLVAEWIQQQRQRYNIVKIAADSFRLSLLKRELETVGYSAARGDIKMVRPSDIMLVQQKINSMFARGQIAWGDDPMMRWYTNNTKLEPAPNNNFKYGKIEQFSRKTDGFMAFVHAVVVEDSLPIEVEPVFAEPIIF